MQRNTDEYKYLPSSKYFADLSHSQMNVHENIPDHTDLIHFFIQHRIPGHGRRLYNDEDTVCGSAHGQ